jgi:hypothetical protein
MARPATSTSRLLAGSREPCRVATTASIDPAAGGLLTIDGVTVEPSDRVLVKDQADQRENGIYGASAGEWYRASDARSPRAIDKGVTVHVQEGTANGGKVYAFQTLDPVLGTDDIQISFSISDDIVADAEDEIQQAADDATAAIDAAEDALEAAVDEALEDIAEAGEEALDAIAAAGGAITGIVSPIIIAENTFGTKGSVELWDPETPPDYVRTAGYATAGDDGGALYMKVGSEPAHAGKIQSADGTWWELARQTVTPQMFGAVGELLTSDSAALQDYFDYLKDRRVDAVCAGMFLLSEKLTLNGDPTSGFACHNIHFQAYFWTSETWDEEAIRFQNCHDFAPTGYLQLHCAAVVGGGTVSAYTSRRQWDGIVFDACTRLQANMTISVEGVKRWGVRITGSGNIGRIAHIRTRYCGSGRGGTLAPAGAFTSRTQSGPSLDTDQRSTLEGVTVPAELQVDDMVVINENAYWVTDFDAGAGTVTVFPWVIETTGTIVWGIGGTFSEEGANANVWHYSSINSSLGGCGYRAFSSNPGNISSFHSASNVFGIIVGRGIVSNSAGGSIDECYIEGGDAHDIVYFQATTALTSMRLNTTGGFTPAKVRRAQANNGVTFDSAKSVPSAEFYYLGNRIKAGNFKKNGGVASVSLSLGTGPRNIYNDAPNITLNDVASLDNLGHNEIVWTCYGSGANGQPTGTTTVTAGAGTTVNGAASVTFGGFNKPPSFKAYRVDGATPNWVVHRTDVEARTVSADHANTATVTLQASLSATTNIWATELTAHRTVTLSTLGLGTNSGARFRIVRKATATGAFNLNVGTGPLKALAVGQWCEVEYDGAAWALTAAGAL